MKLKYIKYKPEQVNLSELYRFSPEQVIDSVDIDNGTLVVGCTDDGKNPAMGYLRSITRDVNTGRLTYEIVNAVEGMEYITIIEKPLKVNLNHIPYTAAFDSPSEAPIVGKVSSCNGEITRIFDGNVNVLVHMNSIRQIMPLL